MRAAAILAALLVLSLFAVVLSPGLPAATPKTTWAKGMDDDAGKAAATAVDLLTLPGAETDGQATAYPVRDRLYTQSLDGTWNFKLIPGLTVAETNWTDGFGPIQVPGNWATQGYRNPTYGNQIPELSGLYERKFRVSLQTAGGGRGATALPAAHCPLPSTLYPLPSSLTSSASTASFSPTASGSTASSWARSAAPTRWRSGTSPTSSWTESTRCAFR